MNTRKVYIGLIILLTILTSGCKDFLDEKSQNMAYVERVEDLNEILIGECYWPGGLSLDTLDAATLGNWTKIVSTMESYFPYVHLLDDDVTEYMSGPLSAASEKNYIRLKAANLHHWQPDPFYNSENVEIKDVNWSKTWSRIAALNSIIFQVGEMRNNADDKVLCNKVEGEARFLRAQYYFYLANLYGLPYSKATANTDLCIPLKISEDIEDRYFSRETTGKVYGQMVDDLTRATELLRGIEQLTKYRTNQAAAFALLSRVYLYMEEYEQTIVCADSVLENRDYKLLDLNDYRKGHSAVYIKSPEVIFSHGPNTMAMLHVPVFKQGINWVASAYTSSDDLMTSFDTKDLRLNAFFITRTSPGDGFRCVKTRGKADEVSDIMAIRLPEIYLNKAEALALLGRDGEARAVLQELRAMRFSPENLSTVSESGEDLVNFIRKERRCELCYEGHRWFDLRRYAVNSVYPYTKSIEHISLIYEAGRGTYAEGKYILKPYPEDKGAYMLPIPSYAIDFNEGALTNEERNTREIISE